jgi:SagB-type dehydrogenase family enzyme
VDIKAHQAHYQPANMALQRKHKTWPLAPRVALPTLDLGLLTGTAAAALAASAIGSRTSAAGVGGGATGGPRRDRVSLPEMGLLLGVTAGWRNDEVTERRPERVFRWTASGGNIGSVVAYLVAREVDGLDPGIYGYVPSTHELALIDPCPDAMPGPGPASLALVADLGRVAYKYAAFALRVVLLDAGCAQATLLAAARELALPARIAPRWDDEAVAQALAIELDAEPVTAIVHLGGTR